MPVETSPTEQSSHEAPEIAIGIIFTSLKFHTVLIIIRLLAVHVSFPFLVIEGSVEEMSNHGPHCQCKDCDSDGICLKTCGYNFLMKPMSQISCCLQRVLYEKDANSFPVNQT